MDHSLRDNLLVTAGRRAADMENLRLLELPNGVEGEAKLAQYISSSVDMYLEQVEREPFDIYIETTLRAMYGPSLV